MLNLQDKIKNKLPKNVQKVLSLICENKDDFKICLVGGVVRDLILDKDILDVDITVEDDALKLAKLLEKKGTGKIKQIQKDLKTVKMLFPADSDGVIEIDFASTRKESYPKKGCMPQILEIGCPLIEDVKRRDFTVNSLILSLNAEDYGDVIDYVGGLEDLQNKLLRVLHDDSFIDDPTRIIRGLKFSVRFDFKLEEHTLHLQQDYLTSHISPDVCTSRIKSELSQTFSLNSPKAYDLFVIQEIFRLINPEFHQNIDSEQIRELIDKYKPAHLWFVYAAVFFFDSGFSELFAFDKEEKKILTDISNLCSHSHENDNFSVYKFFDNKALEAILVYYLLSKDNAAVDYLEHFSHVKLEISGKDLIEMGLKPSEQFSELLDALLEEKLSGNLFSRDDELRFVRFQIKQLKK